MAKANLKQMDLNKLYLLSMPIKLGIAAVVSILIVVLAYFVLFSTQLTELSELEEKEGTLKTELENKAIQAANYKSLEAELVQLRQAFAVLLKQLPTDSEVPRLIQELNQAATNNGMSFDSLQPQAKVQSDAIDILPYKVSLTGDYMQLANFARDVGNLSRIVTLDEINLKPKNDAKGKTTQLELTATANTYTAAAQKAEEPAAENTAASE